LGKRRNLQPLIKNLIEKISRYVSLEDDPWFVKGRLKEQRRFVINLMATTDFAWWLPTWRLCDKSEQSWRKKERKKAFDFHRAIPTFAPRNEKTNLSLFTSAVPEIGFLTRFPAFF
jgi:hypothetical protein